MTLAIGLLIVAVMLVMLELALPSFGLLSILAATCYSFSLINAFEVSSTAGWTIVGVGIFLLPLAIAFGLKILPHTPIGKRLFLHGPKREEVHADSSPRASLLGMKGESLSPLRPSGIALIDGKRVDVTSHEAWIDKGTPIVVTAVEGTRIVVKQLETSQHSEGQRPRVDTPLS